MRTTLKWLQEHHDISQKQSIQQQINHIEQCFLREGIEIDNIHYINPIYVGKIVQITQPKSMKVQVCQVQLPNYTQSIQILCGANNIYENMHVIVATEGTTLHNGIALSKRKINKITSHGMILSKDELGFLPSNTIDHEGGVLEYKKQNVQLLHFDDVMFDISTPANRVDLKCTRGLARLLGKLKPLNLFTNFEHARQISIDNQTELPVAISMVDNYQIDSKVHLFMNRIDKISNNSLQTFNDFIINDIGHPINIFDQSHLTSDQFTVQNINNTFILYNENKKIADIGHKTHLGYNKNTKNIAIEVSYLKPQHIKNVNTISSSYFALGIDQEQEVLLYVLGLLKHSSQISHPVYSGYKQKSHNLIHLTCKYFYDKTGTSISLSHMKEKLEQKGFTVNYIKLSHSTSDVNQEFALAITTPSWRTDIKNTDHVIEELVRKVSVYTNDSQKSGIYKGTNCSYTVDDLLERDVITQLYRLGFEEIVCYGFTRHKNSNSITIKNPIDNTKPYLQTNLLDNMIDYAVTRLKIDKQIKLFQIGYTFHKNKQASNKKIAIIIGGKSDKNIVWHGNQFQDHHLKYYLSLVAPYVFIETIKKTKQLYVCEGYMLRNNKITSIDMNGKYFDVSFYQSDNQTIIWSQIAALTTYPLILFDRTEHNNKKSYSATHYCDNAQEHQDLLNQLKQLNLEIR